MNTEQILLKIIKESVNPSEDNSIANYILDDQTQKGLYILSKKHDLSHLVWNIVKNKKIILNKKIEGKFLEENILSISRYERINYDGNLICKLFEEENIPYIPLKGMVIRKYYPEKWMRTSCDIDILVREEDVDKAIKTLEQNDFKVNKRTYHDVSITSSAGVHLELHFSIKENIECIDSLLEKVWEYSKHEDGKCLHVLSDEFLMFHIVAHTMYHFVGGGCGIRALLDVFLLQKHLKIDENKLNTMLESCGIIKFYNELLTLANVWFGDAENTPITSLMSEYILSGGVYGDYKNKFAVQKATKTKNNYIRSRIFLSRELLESKYPTLKKHKWLLPFYQMRRWMNAVFSGKVKKVGKELGEYDSVTNENKEKVQQMLNELEIKI